MIIHNKQTYTYRRSSTTSKYIIIIIIILLECRRINVRDVEHVVVRCVACIRDDDYSGFEVFTSMTQVLTQVQRQKKRHRALVLQKNGEAVIDRAIII